jgi:hypothetical protein
MSRREIDCNVKIWMKSRIFDSEDARLLRIGSF